jgi:hypothetical protein
MENKINIPEDLIQVCRDLAKVAKASGLHSLSGKFTPLHSSWGGDINFSWEAGRHGEDSDQIKITSSFFVFTHVIGQNIKN